MDDILLQIADPTVGVVLGGCGSMLTVRRRQSLVGPLMLLGCGSWFLGSLLSAALFFHRGPLVHLHISYPTGRIRRLLAIVTVTCVYLVSIVEAIAANLWVTLSVAVLVALAAADIYAGTSGRARKAGGPALAAALTFASVLALGAANQLLHWQNDRLILLLYDLAICLVALLLTADLLWGRWTEATVADFVTQLGVRPDAGTLSTAIRRALGDPTAAVGFWLPDQRRYVDDSGAPFDPPTDRTRRAVIEINDHGEPAAMLVHDTTAQLDPQLITDVIVAVRVALGNARLRARIRAGVVELGQARRRIVESADAQRRQLEADLDVGPRRRLTALTSLLEQAETEADPGRREKLRAILTEVADAEAELTELAEGIRPAALQAGGLAEALPAVIARARPTRVKLNVTASRLPPAIEGAVYFACAEALANVTKHAQATDASVDVTVHSGEVMARILDDGIGGADLHGSGLRGLRDRIEALDGTLTVGNRPGGGTVIEAMIPVAGAP